MTAGVLGQRDGANFIEHLLAVGGPPLVTRDDPPARRALDADTGDLAAPGILRPEIDSFDFRSSFGHLHPDGDDIAVAEPGRFVMRVVVGTDAFVLDDGPSTRHRHAAGGVERPEVRLGDTRGGVIARYQIVAREEVELLGLLS